VPVVPKYSPADFCHFSNPYSINDNSIRYYSKFKLRKHYCLGPSVTAWLFAKILSLCRLHLIAFFQPLVTGHRWGSDQRPIKKQTALRCLKAVTLSPQSDKAQAELRLLYQSVNQPAYSSTREYHPKVLGLLHLLQCIAAYAAMHCLGFLERHNMSVFYCRFSSGLVARSRKPIKYLQYWRPRSKDVSSAKPSAKTIRLILPLPTVTPALTRLLPSIQFI